MRGVRRGKRHPPPPCVTAGNLVALAASPGPPFLQGEEKGSFNASRFDLELRGRSFDANPKDRCVVFTRVVTQQNTATLNLIQVANWLSEVRTRTWAK